MRGSTITLPLAYGKTTYCGKLYQYDYGQKLLFTGVDLPETYEVHFANSEIGQSKTAIGTAEAGVIIPDEYLTAGSNIHVWIYLHDSATDGETEYHGVIVVSKRAYPSDEEPTPEQQSAITQAIAALDTAVSRAEDAAEDAETAAEMLMHPTATAETLPTGSDATAEYHDGVFTFGLPAGAKGETGAQGMPGVSPAVATSAITGGHRVTVTDADGSRSFDVLDGATGAKGEKGDPGEVSTAQLATALATKADIIISSATGAIASFADGADDLPVRDLTVQIEPVQEGSGDPSPDNVRPITGWTGAKVTRTGVNVWDEEWEVGTYSGTTGEKVSGSTNIRSKNRIPVLPNTTYYCKTPFAMYVFEYDADGNYLGYVTKLNNTIVTKGTTRYVTFYVLAGYGTTYNHDISINYPATDTTYHSGKDNATLSINWESEAGTVYGGSLDVTTGVLTVDRAMIASYNGETLPGEWISDRDVYASGTTPTTGAQVVYELATPQTYQLTPQEVKTLLGNNNIYSDTGDSSVTYPADTKLYIDGKIAAALGG